VAQDTIPKLSGDIRPLIPKLGLRNYWYPAVNDRAVGGRKPRKLYDSPEKLSGTDAEVIQWRRLVVTRHYGGRRAPFDYKNPDGLDPENVPLSRVSVRYFQEQMKKKAAAAD
jgi:hypothetical protein